MRRLLLINFLALQFLLGPNKVLGQSSELAQLEGITLVVENLDRKETMLGLNEEWIKAHTLALLRHKVPRIVVNHHRWKVRCWWMLPLE